MLARRLRSEDCKRMSPDCFICFEMLGFPWGKKNWRQVIISTCLGKCVLIHLWMFLGTESNQNDSHRIRFRNVSPRSQDFLHFFNMCAAPFRAVSPVNFSRHSANKPCGGETLCGLCVGPVQEPCTRILCGALCTTARPGRDTQRGI